MLARPRLAAVLAIATMLAYTSSVCAMFTPPRSTSPSKTARLLEELDRGHYTVVDDIRYRTGHLPHAPAGKVTPVISLCGSNNAQHKLFSLYRQFYYAWDPLWPGIERHFPKVIQAASDGQRSCFLVSTKCTRPLRYIEGLQPEEASDALQQIEQVLTTMKAKGWFLQDALRDGKIYCTTGHAAHANAASKACYNNGAVVFLLGSQKLVTKPSELVFFKENSKLLQINAITTAMETVLANLYKQARGTTSMSINEAKAAVRKEYNALYLHEWR
ncbi:hypothetical protein SYNPS1DRAFT_28967 [Syncephalis pseudoplumigaleata]|uniref:Uncharacterized protein n=1 Tax=Syncephalis pseudoplumigaleata TaxID=1712513 RepID=A0A4P9YZ82_9FUNG|nr:hypothetical protein SYNPS1DRAFT_28967 [Syncephalis pseudoplumigaleata]|eukprot:RKP25298.1 hypothetical protein SYNPS1DRAFT_28967 [Syncephalis pseudoplumigaleata]